MTRAEISEIIYKRIVKRIVLKALDSFDRIEVNETEAKLDGETNPTGNAGTKKLGEKLFTFSENCGIIKAEWDESLHPRGDHGRFKDGSSPKNSAAASRNKKSARVYKISDYSKAVVGMKTGDGVKITKCIAHAFDRLIERDIWPKSLVNALKTKSVPAKQGRVAYINKGTHVIVDNKTGEIITAIYKGGKSK